MTEVVYSQCDWCLREFSRAAAKKRRYCSRECRRLAFNFNKARTWAAKPDRQCEWCHSTYQSKASHARYCSKKCTQDASIHLSIHGPYIDRCDIPWKPCEGCGAIGSFYHHRKFCGDCRAERRRAHWRRKNAARRGAKVKGANFSIEHVGDRDGWRCHLCGKRVNPSIVNPDPRAPTIDHLIPIADGGLDELSNVALAHRSCNCARGARGLAQLRLAV